MTVVIVCVSGVSGTFIASRLRRAGIAEPIRVAGLEALSDAPAADGDLVLVTPQIESSAPRVRELSPGARVILVTRDEVALSGAGRLADRVRRELGTPTPDEELLP